MWPEEAVFRGALRHLAADAFGPLRAACCRRRRSACPTSLTHGRRAHPSSGRCWSPGCPGRLVLGWPAERSGSVAAPMLAHTRRSMSAGALAVLAGRNAADGCQASMSCWISAGTVPRVSGSARSWSTGHRVVDPRRRCRHRLRAATIGPCRKPRDADAVARAVGVIVAEHLGAGVGR